MHTQYTNYAVIQIPIYLPHISCNSFSISIARLYVGRSLAVTTFLLKNCLKRLPPHMDGIFALGYMSIINWPLAGDPTTSQKALVKLPYALWLKWMCQSRFSRSLTRIFLPSQLLNIAHRSFASSVFRLIMCIVFFFQHYTILDFGQALFSCITFAIPHFTSFFLDVTRIRGIVFFSPSPRSPTPQIRLLG